MEAEQSDMESDAVQPKKPFKEMTNFDADLNKEMEEKYTAMKELNRGSIKQR